MKIQCIGTGTMGSITRGSQSLVIDDMLIDVGSGVVKKMESLGIYTKTIKYLLITHVHSDHFVDLSCDVFNINASILRNFLSSLVPTPILGFFLC